MISHTDCPRPTRRAMAAVLAATLAAAMPQLTARGDVATVQDTGSTAGVSFDRSVANQLSVTAPDGAVIQYSRFDIGQGQGVNFQQPAATARAFNRIDSANPSRIDGSLTANGTIYLVNPAGIVFGQNAVVNVGALYAAAGNFTTFNDFNTTTALTGDVINLGSLTAGQAGGDHTLALLGQRVANLGSVSAPDGTIVMAAGDSVILTTPGDFTSVRVDVSQANVDAARTADAANPAGSPLSSNMFAAGDPAALAAFPNGAPASSQVVLAGDVGARTDTLTVNAQFTQLGDPDTESGAMTIQTQGSQTYTGPRRELTVELPAVFERLTTERGVVYGYKNPITGATFGTPTNPRPAAEIIANVGEPAPGENNQPFIQQVRFQGNDEAIDARVHLAGDTAVTAESGDVTFRSSVEAAADGTTPDLAITAETGNIILEQTLGGEARFVRLDAGGGVAATLVNEEAFDQNANLRGASNRDQLSMDIGQQELPAVERRLPRRLGTLALRTPGWETHSAADGETPRYVRMGHLEPGINGMPATAVGNAPVSPDVKYQVHVDHLDVQSPLLLSARTLDQKPNGVSAVVSPSGFGFSQSSQLNLTFFRLQGEGAAGVFAGPVDAAAGISGNVSMRIDLDNSDAAQTVRFDAPLGAGNVGERVDGSEALIDQLPLRGYFGAFADQNGLTFLRIADNSDQPAATHRAVFNGGAIRVLDNIEIDATALIGDAGRNLPFVLETNVDQAVNDPTARTQDNTGQILILGDDSTFKTNGQPIRLLGNHIIVGDIDTTSGSLPEGAPIDIVLLGGQQNIPFQNYSVPQGGRLLAGTVQGDVEITLDRNIAGAPQKLFIDELTLQTAPSVTVTLPDLLADGSVSNIEQVVINQLRVVGGSLTLDAEGAPYTIAVDPFRLTRDSIDVNRLSNQVMIFGNRTGVGSGASNGVVVVQPAAASITADEGVTFGSGVNFGVTTGASFDDFGGDVTSLTITNPQGSIRINSPLVSTDASDNWDVNLTGRDITLDDVNIGGTLTIAADNSFTGLTSSPVVYQANGIVITAASPLTSTNNVLVFREPSGNGETIRFVSRGGGITVQEGLALRVINGADLVFDTKSAGGSGADIAFGGIVIEEGSFSALSSRDIIVRNPNNETPAFVSARGNVTLNADRRIIFQNPGAGFIQVQSLQNNVTLNAGTGYSVPTGAQQPALAAVQPVADTIDVRRNGVPNAADRALFRIGDGGNGGGDGGGVVDPDPVNEDERRIDPAVIADVSELLNITGVAGSEETGDVSGDALVLSRGDLRVLQRMGLRVRNIPPTARAEVRQGILQGGAVGDDIAQDFALEDSLATAGQLRGNLGQPDQPAGVAVVGVTRTVDADYSELAQRREVTQQVLEQWRELFGSERDPDYTRVREAVARLVTAYMQEHGGRFEATDFRSFVERQDPETLKELRDLITLLTLQARMLADPTELSHVRSETIRQITPQNLIDPAVLEQALLPLTAGGEVPEDIT